MEITITNDFHNTEYTARPRKAANGRYYISRETVRKIRRALCPATGCLCGGALGERGPQPHGYGYDEHQDGTVEIIEFD